jgi:hypothetical protein
VLSRPIDIGDMTGWSSARRRLRGPTSNHLARQVIERGSAQLRRELDAERASMTALKARQATLVRQEREAAGRLRELQQSQAAAAAAATAAAVTSAGQRAVAAHSRDRVVAETEAALSENSAAAGAVPMVVPTVTRRKKHTSTAAARPPQRVVRARVWCAPARQQSRCAVADRCRARCTAGVGGDGSSGGRERARGSRGRAARRGHQVSAVRPHATAGRCRRRGRAQLAGSRWPPPPWSLLAGWARACAGAQSVDGSARLRYCLWLAGGLLLGKILRMLQSMVGL